jgi:hypothetical protein
VAEIDTERSIIRFAGLGNVAATVLDGDSRRGLVSLPGIAGHQRPSIREFDYAMPAHARLIMHSDGVSNRWAAVDYQPLAGHSPLLLAASVLRDAGIRRDDACVLAARVPS